MKDSVELIIKVKKKKKSSQTNLYFNLIFLENNKSNYNYKQNQSASWLLRSHSKSYEADNNCKKRNF